MMLRRLLPLMLIAAYPAAAFYPFRVVSPWQKNDTALLPTGGYRFAGSGIALTRRAPLWLARAKQTHRLEIDLEVRSLDAKQEGPARIFTISADPEHRDLTVGQEGADLHVRLRRPGASENGTPAFVVPGVFRGRGWVGLRVGVSQRELRVTVDGVEVVRSPLRRKPLADWSLDYPLALGDELTGHRGWRGEVRRARVAVGSQLVDYARPGNLSVPNPFFRFHRQPDLALFSELLWYDVLVNLFGFVPLGFWMGWLGRRRRWRGAWRECLLIFGLAVSLEVFQLWCPTRVPSVNDIFFNMVGAALGIFLGRRLAGHRARPSGVAQR